MIGSGDDIDFDIKSLSSGSVARHSDESHNELTGDGDISSHGSDGWREEKKEEKVKK
jgi:hypothetical protein